MLSDEKYTEIIRLLEEKSEVHCINERLQFIFMCSIKYAGESLYNPDGKTKEEQFNHELFLLKSVSYIHQKQFCIGHYDISKVKDKLSKDIFLLKQKLGIINKWDYEYQQVLFDDINKAHEQGKSLIYAKKRTRPNG